MLRMFGTVLALWMTGTSLNVVSLLGAIIGIGIVAKNGILMLDFVKHLREGGLIWPKRSFGRDAAGCGLTGSGAWDASSGLGHRRRCGYAQAAGHRRHRFALYFRAPLSRRHADGLLYSSKHSRKI